MNPEIDCTRTVNAEPSSTVDGGRENRMDIGRPALERNSVFRMKKWYTFLTFFVPFFFMAAAFAVQQVHPFGSRMILTVDLYHQYAPFVAELRDKLLSGDSLFFSWHIGLGTDFWATFANYVASPLNFLAVLFPQKYSPDVIALLVCLRAGLSGLFCGKLLADMDKKRKDVFLVCFSTLYALCGWAISYFWNIMWHDAVVLLPLIVLGLRKLIRDKSPWLYCVSLFLCLWSNFFAGYFICFFVILFMPVCYFSLTEKPSLRSAWSSTWRFGLFSGLGGGMAAALLIPTWMSLQNSSAVGDAFPDKNYLTQNAFDFFSRFFLGSKPNIRDGMANVYCGVIIMILVPLFFLCKRVKLSDKIGYGLIMVFLYFSFSDRMLNFIWHGFHFPNQISYRQSFLMSFVLILMGYKVLRNLKTFTFREIGAVVTGLLAYLVLYEHIGTGTEEILAILLTAAFVLLYTLVFYYIFNRDTSIAFQRKALAAVILIESLVASQVSIGMVAMNESFTGWDFYGKKDSEVTAFLEEREEIHGPFFRAEVYPAFISNQPALYHMKGMSIFSSTANESFIKFMKSLGFHNNGINGTRNFGLNPVSASLLGIRYLIDLEDTNYVPEVFPLLEDTGNLRIRENPDALSLGYMVSETVLDYETPTRVHPFANTNTFVNALGAADVFLKRDVSVGEMTNASKTGGSAVNGYTFSATKSDVKTVINLQPKDFLDEEMIYLYVQSSKSVSVKTSRTPVLSSVEDLEESVTSEKTQEGRTQQIIEIGRWSDEEDINVELTWGSGGSGNITVFCYTLDEPAFNEMIEQFSASQLEVDTLTSTLVEGSVDVQKDGVLLLTMTQDAGWTAIVDGEEAELHVIGEALLGLSLSPGLHEIRLSYMPVGFKEGLIISLASFTMLVMALVLSILLRRRRARRAILAEEEAAYRAAAAYLANITPDAEGELELSDEATVHSEGEIPEEISESAEAEQETCEDEDVSVVDVAEQSSEGNES